MLANISQQLDWTGRHGREMKTLPNVGMLISPACISRNLNIEILLHLLMHRIFFNLSKGSHVSCLKISDITSALNVLDFQTVPLVPEASAGTLKMTNLGPPKLMMAVPML